MDVRPQATNSPRRSHVRPDALLRSSAGIAAFFFVTHLVIALHRRWAGPPTSRWGRHLVRLLHLDVEGNIPTWFSSAQLLAAAVFAWLIAEYVASRLAWRATALLFVYLSLDETAQIHEMFSFIIVYSILLALVVLVGARFLLRLPRRMLLLLGIGATIYCFGALVLERIGRRHTPGVDSMRYAVVVGLEEALEMVGVAIMIYAETSYLLDLRLAERSVEV